ncbi:MAG: asparagine synthase (glutamine-hydrolyzing) [Planctomycetota bacterium]|nr:asparagine synthase (glutamine-hydrolyzing) [Planctomycetota bacterium]
MCGIVGVARLQSSQPWSLTPAIASRMVDSLRYRGPDGRGDWASPDQNCWLGHTRLAIIDRAAGHQPMANEDDSVWVTFNGEIYNHLDLQRELIAAGHRFRTHCDTEVLLHGYEQWGEEGLLSRIRGMYAFAIYDMRRPRPALFIARDRLGKKPLYYWSDGSLLLFASEIKALLVHPALQKRSVDLDALCQYLTLRYVPSPLTLFRDIRKLPGGHFLHFDLGAGPTQMSAQKPEPKRYWDVSFHRHDPEPSFDAALEKTDELLQDAVSKRLMSEVPLGAQLSGGVDSSLIVAHMERLRLAAGLPESVRTYAIGFDEPGFSELPYAKSVADRYHTRHHEITVGFDDFIDHFARLSWVYDEPITESSAIPTYLLCRFAKRDVTVMLTGEGGDELFAGYAKFAADRYSQWLDWLPPGLRFAALRAAAAAMPFGGRRARIAMESLSIADPAERYVSWFSAFDGAGLAELLTPELGKKLASGGAAARLRVELDRCDSPVPLDRMLYSDLHTWLVDNLLLKGDRMSMASGIEARMPFLDQALVEYAAGLPPQYKVNGRTTKFLLKRLAEKYIPRETIYRKKVGFTVPLNPWFRGPLAPLVRELLLGERSLARGYYRPDVLRRVVEDHLDGRVERSRSIWSLLALEIWHRLFVDDDGTEAASDRLRGTMLALIGREPGSLKVKAS